MDEELDAFLRHQVYVEGYKNGQATQFDRTAEELVIIIVTLFAKTGYSSFDEMPKKTFNKFVSNVIKQYKAKLQKFGIRTTADLKRFMATDLTIQQFMFRTLGGVSYTSPGIGKLWASIQNAPLAGAGTEPKKILTTFFNSVLNDVRRVLTIAFANNAPLKDLLAEVRGTRAANFRDGLLRKMKNQFSTTVQTYIQHITSYLNYLIGSLFFESYQWVSVLDSKTTDICRSRDGRIYLYGSGPLPPAHYNCRSTIRPVMVAANDNMPTYYEWIKRQPVLVQNDVLGVKAARQLRKGDIKSENLPRFDGIKSLTLDEYAAKQNRIVNQN